MARDKRALFACDEAVCFLQRESRAECGWSVAMMRTWDIKSLMQTTNQESKRSRCIRMSDDTAVVILPGHWAYSISTGMSTRACNLFQKAKKAYKNKQALKTLVKNGAKRDASWCRQLVRGARDDFTIRNRCGSKRLHQAELLHEQPRATIELCVACAHSLAARKHQTSSYPHNDVKARYQAHGWTQTPGVAIRIVFNYRTM
jgi:hypothetical protein